MTTQPSDPMSVKLRMQAMGWKRKALGELRCALIKQQGRSGGGSNPQATTTTEEVMNSMMLILLAALFSMDAGEVAVHATHLFSALAQVQAGPEPVDPHMLLVWTARLYFLDMKATVHFMRPMALDCVGPLRAGAAMLPADAVGGLVSPLVRRKFGSCLLLGVESGQRRICSDAVQQLFGGVRQYLAFQSAARELVSVYGAAAHMYLFAHLFSLMGDALRLYHEAQDDLIILDREDPVRRMDLILSAGIVAVLCTAAFYSEFSTEYSRAVGVMSALKVALAPVLAQKQSTQVTSYRYGQLWALYLGSMWELQAGFVDVTSPATSSSETSSPVWTPWFLKKLRSECKALNVRNWQDLEGVVQAFVPVHDITPPPGNWFNGVVMGFKVDGAARLL